METDKKFCTLCLKTFTKANDVQTGELLLQIQTIKNLFEDLDVDKLKKLLVCPLCWNQLEELYEFKKKLFETFVKHNVIDRDSVKEKFCICCHEKSGIFKFVTSDCLTSNKQSRYNLELLNFCFVYFADAGYIKIHGDRVMLCITCYNYITRAFTIYYTLQRKMKVYTAEEVEKGTAMNVTENVDSGSFSWMNTLHENCIIESKFDIKEEPLGDVEISSSNSNISLESSSNSNISLEPSSNSNILLEPSSNSNISLEPSSNSNISLEPNFNSDISPKPTTAYNTFEEHSYANMYPIIHSKPKNIKSSDIIYKCEYCTIFFDTKQKLDAHKKGHYGMRPYDCPYCDRSFWIKSQLKYHLKHWRNQEIQAVENKKPFPHKSHFISKDKKLL